MVDGDKEAEGVVVVGLDELETDEAGLKFTTSPELAAKLWGRRAVCINGRIYEDQYAKNPGLPAPKIKTEAEQVNECITSLQIRRGWSRRKAIRHLERSGVLRRKDGKD